VTVIHVHREVERATTPMLQNNGLPPVEWATSVWGAVQEECVVGIVKKPRPGPPVMMILASPSC
jgi:hypothetical protein